MNPESCDDTVYRAGDYTECCAASEPNMEGSNAPDLNRLP